MQVILLIILIKPVNHSQENKAKDLWPHHVVIQFAGGTGFFSAGAGYATRDNKIEADLLYGYVPESVGGVTIHSLSLKGTWHPFKYVAFGKVRIDPLAVGLLASHTFGKQYFGFTPENYPYDYYGFPTSLHAAAFAGGQVNKKVRKNISLSFYYEVIAYDRMLISYFANPKVLKPGDVLSLSLGLKVRRIR